MCLQDLSKCHLDKWKVRRYSKGMRDPRTRMKELRKQRNLTLAELALRAGCAESYLSRIENGTRTPGLTLAFALEEVLGLSAKAWRKAS